MKKVLLLLFLGFASLTLSAQETPEPLAGRRTETSDTRSPKGSAKIKGFVLNATTNEAVQFATVALLNKADNKPIDGVLTDEKGAFVLSRVAAGEYRVSITFIGFRTNTITDVQVPGKGEVNVGKILIQSDVTQLEEITVTGEANLIEDKVDRIVYHAEKDMTNTGGDAADVLKKVPMLSVDLDGNVELRGNSNVRVLINGKPSAIMATNVADALRQIPADIIKSVEVITSPSAKYDAEGTAGIINIITKKNNLRGINGSAYTSVGNRSDNGGVNVNFRRKSFGVNGGMGGHYFSNPGDGYMNRTHLSGQQTTYLNQNSKYRNRGGGMYGQFGGDYDINAQNSVNTSLRINHHQFNHTSLLQSVLTDANGRTMRSQNRSIRSRNAGNNLDWNLGYTRNFKEAGQELSFLMQYTVHNPENESFIDQLGIINTQNRLEQNQNNSRNAETTLQADYVHPFKNKTTLEAGAKAIFRHVSSDFQFSVFDAEREVYQVDPARSNVFSYGQDVIATYGTYTFRWSKFDFKLGSRYEQTYISADFKSSGTSFSRPYGNFIPSVMVSYDLQNNQKLRFGYTQRIQRPQIFYLNPYVNYNDTLNLSYGNPRLDPELSHSFDLGYSAFVDKNSIGATLYWRQMSNAIERIRFVEASGVSRTTYQNIASNGTLGLSLFGSAQPTSEWRASCNLNVYYTSLYSPSLNASNSNWMYSFNLNSSYILPKGFSVQFFGFFSSPRVLLQGRYAGFYNYNIAAKKELFKKKGSVTLNLDNPFTRAMRFKSTFNTPTFVSSDVRNMYRQGVRLSFNYQFGKMDFNAKSRRKKSISNEDAKQGESGSGQ